MMQCLFSLNFGNMDNPVLVLIATVLLATGRHADDDFNEVLFQFSVTVKNGRRCRLRRRRRRRPFRRFTWK